MKNWLRYALLLFGLGLLSSQKLSAQLPNGSSAPNWTATDLNGTSWNLYNVLDQGKSVVLFFMNTNNLASWNYHQSGALNTLYNTYGPPGTNELTVFMIEGNASSPFPCLYGIGPDCAAGSFGDWVTGTPYPIIDDGSDGSYDITPNYNVSSFPIVYFVCPDREIWEVGASPAPQIYNFLANQCFNPLIWELANLNEVSCKGLSNGSIDIEASGTNQPIQYLWSNGETTQDLNNLAAGTYSCTITNPQGEVVTTGPITIGEPPVLEVFLDFFQDVQCGGQLGFIETYVNGGTEDYSFFWSNGLDDEDVYNLPAGTYSLTVTDANGCTDKLSGIQILPISLPTAVLVLPPSLLDCIHETVTLDATGSSTGPNFEYEWQATNGGHIISGGDGLTPEVDKAGVYILTVTNLLNNCKKIVGTPVILDTLPSYADAGPTEYLTCLQSQLTLFGDGSTGPQYTYAWTASNGGNILFGQNTLAAYITDPGTYTLLVTNTVNNCTAESSTSVIEDITPPTVDLTVTGQVNCVGPSVLNCLNCSSGGIFSYLLTGPSNNGPVTFPLNTTVPGLYQLKITNTFNGCTATDAVTVEENKIPPVAMATGGAALHCNQTSLALNGTGSSAGANFSYLWTTATGHFVSGQNQLAPVVDAAGLYVLMVSNSQNGCTATASTTVTQTPPLQSAIANEVDVLCHGNQSGSISVNVSGGNPPGSGYSFMWSNGLSSQNLQNLAAGAYSLTITDADNCTTSIATEITEPPLLLANAAADGQFNFQINDGIASASPAGGAGAYSYLWSNGATTQNLSALAPGDYTVTVTDGNQCTAFATVTVEKFVCTLAAETSSQNVKCFQGSDGSATVTIQGGNLPFGYTWSNGQTTSTATSLAAGTYVVSILDGTNCPLAMTVVVEQPTLLQANTSSTDETANNSNDGTAIANGNGGTPPYSYNWSNGATTQQVGGLPPGTYTVTVFDANNCAIEMATTIAEFVCVIGADLQGSPVSCFGGADGQAVIAVSTPYHPVSFLWSDGQLTATATGLSAGTYSVTATDFKNCPIVGEAIVTQPTQLQSTTSATTVICPEDQNGTATAHPTEGTPPYNFAWSSGSNEATAMGLGVGTYSVVVSDSNGCTVMASASVIAVDLIPPVVDTKDVTLTLDAAGTASLTAGQVDDSSADNCSPVSLALDLTTFTCANLGTNTVSLTATDISGNSASATATVTIIDEISPTISCPGNLTSNHCATPVDYNLPTAADNCTAQSPLLTGGLASGSVFPLDQTTVVTYTVSDQSGNTASCSFTVTIQSDLLTIGSTNIVSCFGGSDGVASITAAGGTMPYAYLWSSGQTDAMITGVPAGTYTVTATDANGCQNPVLIIISQPAAIAPNPTVSDVKCFGESSGAISLSPTGGNPGGYSYSWGGGETSFFLTDIVAGVYMITVSDLKGCTGAMSIPVNQPTALGLSTPLVTNSHIGASNGSILVSTSGGTMPYSFVWKNENGVVVGMEEDLTEVPGGEYTLQITDANGCQLSSQPIVVDEVVGTDNLDRTKSFILSPNPTRGQVWLRSDFDLPKDLDFEITDAAGKMAFPEKGNRQPRSQELDFGKLPPGVYFVKIKLEGQVLTERLILTK